MFYMLDAEPAWMMHPGMGSRRRARIDIGKGLGPTPGGEYGTLGGLDAGHEVVGGVPEGSGRFRPRPENEFVTPELRLHVSFVVGTQRVHHSAGLRLVGEVDGELQGDRGIISSG